MEMKPQTVARSEGFTLVEILIMMVILSYVALGIAGLFSHAMLTNASGHDYALLASEARFALESLQAMPFEDPDNANHPLNDTGTTQNWAPNNPNFVILYTVEDFRIDNWTEADDGSAGWSVPTTGTGTVSDIANLKRITMTVTSTNQVLRGRRVLTVTSLKIPG
jgi:type II secretory pathway pseudopilin PulG